MRNDIRQRMLKAKSLIQQQEYDKARAILKSIDHPTAEKWRAKLDEIAPAKKSHEWVYWLFLAASVVIAVLLVINSRSLSPPVAAPTDTPSATFTYTPPPTQPPPPTQRPAPQYTCNCSKTCSQMTCTEAYYQLNQCGCSRRDSDGDGVPCESVCSGG